jgi:hypothetical protein
MASGFSGTCKAGRTALNSERVSESPLRAGAHIKIGGSILVFKTERDPMATIAAIGSPEVKYVQRCRHARTRFSRCSPMDG